ncbi:MAG: MOSC domain-containing protein [Planctomycetes bacterium]|nr:MOSC domain-containing protein [Planctomycetota bacterium]
MSEFVFRTAAEIEAGLPHLRQSPADHGVLEAIVIRPGPGKRQSLMACRLSPEAGTEGDRWADNCWLKLPDGGPDPDVQICIMNARMIQLIAGDKPSWSQAGDNLFVDFDLRRENLLTGQRLRIGACLVEITGQPHNGCQKFGERFGSDALAWVNSPQGKQLRLRGVYAKVIQAAIVRVGDPIIKVPSDLPLDSAAGR